MVLNVSSSAHAPINIHKILYGLVAKYLLLVSSQTNAVLTHTNLNSSKTSISSTAKYRYMKFKVLRTRFYFKISEIRIIGRKA